MTLPVYLESRDKPIRGLLRPQSRDDNIMDDCSGARGEASNTRPTNNGCSELAETIGATPALEELQNRNARLVEDVHIKRRQVRVQRIT